MRVIVNLSPNNYSSDKSQMTCGLDEGGPEINL